MTNYLVTGGAGFIGSHLASALVASGHFVRVLDDCSTGKQDNLREMNGKIELMVGDVAEHETVRRAVRDIEIVLHQAAIPSVPKSIQDPIASNRATVDGTLNVLVASKESGVRRVVFASSSSVYGEQVPELPKIETMTPRPISPYGVAKLAAEHYCQVFHSVYGLETVCLRYFNVFGPRQDPFSLYAAVIPLFIKALLEGKRPVIFGDGEQTRDFTYVANVVEGNMLAATLPAKQVAGDVFNLAMGGQTSLNTLMEMLQEIINTSIKPTYGPPRQGDIKHSRADIHKARTLMGFKPPISLVDGLRMTADWYREAI